VRELRVNRACNNFTADFSESFGVIAEGNDFGWADEGEVQWIEEQHNVFSFVIGEFNVVEVSLVPGWALEVGGVSPD